jgi:hypothetical protein
MRTAVPLFLVLGVLALSAPVLALSGPSADDLESNRRLLARWKEEDPAHYARLKNDLRAFRALPPERQAALRQLDRQLEQDDPAVRARLWQVMDRYATWLDHLAAADRERVQAAPTAADRLRIIRDLREREWVERLPRTRRQQLAAASAEKRSVLLAEWRRQEVERRQEWQRAAAAGEEPAGWRMPPARVADLSPMAQAYVQVALQPHLSAEERERLRQAEGLAQPFTRTLLELVNRHPPALPGPPLGPARPWQLPKEVRERLQQVRGSERQRVELLKGSWPDFAIAVTRLLRSREGGMPQELGPCRPDDLPPPVRQFLANRLLPKLNDQEKQRLAAAEGRWPDYPREIAQLSRQHGLQVPAPALPGPRGYWERLRAAVRDDKMTR